MPTKEYEKAEQELERLIQLNSRLSETNTKLLENREVLEELTKQVSNAHTQFVPIIKEYLKDIQDIRMTFAREVVDIIRSAAELKGIGKSTEEIIKLREAIDKLDKILTPEITERIKRLIN